MSLRSRILAASESKEVESSSGGLRQQAADQSKRDEIWSFRDGTVGADDSLKSYKVDATDGTAGKVSWASYAPGESYLIITQRRRLRRVHYAVPASVVREVEHATRRVALTVSITAAHSVRHDKPAAPLDPAIVAAFVRGAPGVIDGGLIGGRP